MIRIRDLRNIARPQAAQALHKSRIVFAALVVALLAAPPLSAQAEPMNEARVERIRLNCTAALATLQRVQISDKATRINRGYLYESLLRQMAALNSRAALNTYHVPELAAATAELQREFDDFKTTYTTYDTTGRDLLEFDCQKQPVTFYDRFEEVRNQRARLHQHIEDMEDTLNRYQRAVNTLSGRVAGARS